ncbi:CHAT domain-containing protein [Amycolatopsis solani]|uniref:CHAT domain-containing protein n=1 Tax=Amycolatopsis solani TaxID=3028615 RepID=UPI0025AFBB58|nr:CHAT domain-containing protein [Amycolatopsis sp. MEP2-6]
MPDNAEPVDPIEELIQAHRATGDIEPLLRACEEVRAMISVTPPSVLRNVLHNQLSRALRDLAAATAGTALLEEAIAAARKAVGGEPPDDPWRYVYLNNLAQALGDRFDRTSNLEHLDESERAYRKALEEVPEADTHGLATIRSGLATILTHRYDHTGDPGDIATAIDLCRPTAAMGEPRSSHELASLLGAWFDLEADPSVLSEAIAAAEHATRATDEPGLKVMALTTLGELRTKAAIALDQPGALDRAVAELTEAVRLTPSGSVHHLGRLTALTNTRHEQFRRTGDRALLEDVTARFTEILDRTPAGDVNLPGRETNLALALLDQFRYFGITSALDSASGHLHRARSLIPPHDPFRPMLLSILGSVYLDTANGLAGKDERECVDEAIATLRQALSVATARFSTRGLLVNTLAVALRRHPDQVVRAEAEPCCRAWLATARPTDPGYDLVRSTLAAALLDRLRTAPDRPALEEAEHLARALAIGPASDHRVPVTNQLTLAHLLKIRAEQFGTPAARAEAVSVLHAVVNAPMPPDERVRAYATLGELLAGHDWSGSCHVYATAVELLARMVPRTWRHADREHGLSRFFALASDAAAAALSADDPHLAVELLERGRGILLGEAHADPAALERLTARHPGLAQRLREVDARISALRASSESPVTHAELLLRRRLEAEESAVLAEIRAQPGFERFHQGPSCAELLARMPGPVVIVNACKHRADALLLADGVLTIVPLPRLRHEHLVDQTARFLQHRDRFVLGPGLAAVDEATVDLRVRSLHNILGWLWESVAAPVLGALGPRRRVWWCPTGLVTLLPIHAAGRYRRTTDDELPEAVLDYVVPSYVPTLRSLLAPEAPPGNQRVLAVGVGETPGQVPLGAATGEARAAAAALQDSTLLLDAEATRPRLLAELPRHTWFHFAGHGWQDTYSFESACLVSHDHASTGGLTFADLRAARPARAHLAYLSACQSASGRLVLPDEAVHLAGAMLAAGFDRVVAANWKVRDSVAKRVAELFYRFIVDPVPTAGRAAEALHAAVQLTRKELARDLDGADRDLAVLLWGAFAHFGR